MSELAASVGAGISMGLAEELSDDGEVTGRGTPVTRGVITGFATALGGDASYTSFQTTEKPAIR